MYVDLTSAKFSGSVHERHIHFYSVRIKYVYYTVNRTGGVLSRFRAHFIRNTVYKLYICRLYHSMYTLLSMDFLLRLYAYVLDKKNPIKSFRKEFYK